MTRRIESSDKWVRWTERKMREALSARDAIPFKKYCDELGLIGNDIPDKELYEQATADLMMQKQMQSKLEATASATSYSGKISRGRKPYSIPESVSEARVRIKTLCEQQRKPVPENLSTMHKKQVYAIYFSMQDKAYRLNLDKFR